MWFLTPLAQVWAKPILFQWTPRTSEEERTATLISQAWKEVRCIGKPAGKHNLIMSVTPKDCQIRQHGWEKQPQLPGAPWHGYPDKMRSAGPSKYSKGFKQISGTITLRGKDMDLYWWQINIDHKAIDFSLHFISVGNLVLRPPKFGLLGGWLVIVLGSGWEYFDTIISIQSPAFIRMCGFSHWSVKRPWEYKAL